MYAGDWLFRLSQLGRQPRGREGWSVPANVWGLGVTSLLTDVSSEMVVSILPAYLVLASGFAPLMLGLATGNLETGARIKLDRGGLNRYFSFGGFGSDSEDRAELVRKAAKKAAHKKGESILPSDIFVIGDTNLDIEAGKRAGFKTIGVATGNYSLEELLSAGAGLAVVDFEQGRDHFFRSTFIE